MRSIYILLSVCARVPGLLQAHGNGAPAGRTGVEGETTCLSCHRGNDYVSKDLGVGYRSYATHHEATLRIGESGHYGNVVKQTPLPPIDKSTHMNASTECSACHR